MRDTRFKAYIGWAGRNAGVARVGSVRVAPAIDTLGYDRIGYEFTPSYVGLYDDVSGPGRFAATDFTITRGRTGRWDNIVAGECVLTLHDMGDGRYNPNNAASPLAGLIEPMVPCKVAAVLEDGTEEDLFNGWLDEQQDNPEIGAQQATFNFKDLLMWLDGDNPVIAETGPIYVGEAIGLVLDWFEWTNPAMRSLAKGSLLPGFSAAGDKSGLVLIGEMLTVDLGLFFASRKGIATYLDRYEYARRNSIGLFDAAKAQIPGVARKNIKNRITVSYDTGDPGTTTQQTVEDATSRRKYGPLTWPPVTSRYFGSDAQALSYGRFKVSQTKTPLAPMWSFTVSEGNPGDFDRIARADLVDRVTVPVPDAKDFHIERIVHRGAAGVLFQSDWTLSERPSNLPALVGRAAVAPDVQADGYDRVTY